MRKPNTPSEEPGACRHQVGPSLTLLVSVFLLGLALLHIAGMDEQARETHAGLSLFRSDTVIVDLKTNGQDSVSGVLGGLMAPGDVEHGVIMLSAETKVLEEPYYLDIDLEFEQFIVQSGKLTPEQVHPEFPDQFVFKVLRYGPDDLLADDPIPDDRNLTREIDANPARGNGDGWLSLREFRVGINDLPRPGPHSDPTPFEVAVKMLESTGPEFMNQGVDLTFTFHLRPVHESKFN